MAERRVKSTGEAYDEDVTIIEDHLHPPFTAVVPNGAYRRGALTMVSNPVDTDTFTLGLAGGIVYTFKDDISGSPGAGNVWIKTQVISTLTACQLLYDAICGVTDAVNINYGSPAEKPHPNVLAGITVIGFAIGAASIAANASGSLYLRERGGDVVGAGAPITLGETGAWCTLTAFIRTYSARYVMTGNSANLEDRVAGDYLMIEPTNWIKDDAGRNVYWDPSIVIVENTDSAASIIIECDMYYSLDEVTFTKGVEGLNLSFGSVGVGGSGSQQYTAPHARSPPGAGLYVKLRSNDTNPAKYVDIKVEYHRYPYGV